MASESDVGAALDRLRRALSGLDDAIDRRFEHDHDFGEAQAEVGRMNADRSRLAQELDKAEDRANRLEEANREVSRRLVTSMETIRAVLDR
jgi:chromosome segregation ATPase